MRTSRFTAFLFTVFLMFLVIPQSAEAQDPHRTKHLKSWSAINFSDNSNIQVKNKNAHCLVAEVTNIPGRKRFLIYFNSEFETGKAVVTERVEQTVNACEQLVRDIVSRSHAVTFFGTNNSVPNRQSSNLPLSETTSPAREQSNDFRLAQLRANAGRNLVVSELSDIALKNAGNYIPAKYETETVSAPDSLQRLDSLSDQASLEFRKAFFIMAEIYQSGAPTASAFENRIKAMEDDVNERFERVHSQIDSLGREHKRTRRLAAANADSINAVRNDLQDVRQTAKAANRDNSFSALSAGYRSELGLDMAEIGFETGDPFSVRFAIGANPGGIGTKLCKGDIGVSNALFAEFGGAYTLRPTDRFSIGVGASATTTLFSLEGEDKGLFVFSAGPDVFARFEVVDHVHLHGGAGLNGRHFMEDGVELTGSADRIGTQFSVGVTISF